MTAGTGIPSSTQVVTPLSGPVPLHSSPDGPVSGSLALTVYGGPTWVPVIATAGGWDQVQQLTTSPNGSTAWLGGRGGPGGQHSVGRGGVAGESVPDCLCRWPVGGELAGCSRGSGYSYSCWPDLHGGGYRTCRN